MTSQVWASRGWLDESLRWVDACLTERGLVRDGEPEQRIRPWATVLRIPIRETQTAGCVWFKASAAGTAHEPALLDVLARVVPTNVLEPLGLDLDRGWMLLPDGGTTLRDRLADRGAGDRWPAWRAALGAYAGLQLAASAVADQLVLTGVPDMRPTELDSVLSTVLASADVPTDLRARVERRRRELADWSAELGVSPLVPSVQHDDLHSGNVLVSGATPRFFDWGDSSVAHPLCSFMFTRVTVAAEAGVAEDGPELTRLADEYLEAIGGERPMHQLRRDLALAEHLVLIGRAATWQRGLASATAEERAQWGEPVLWCLAALADEAPRAR